MYYVHLIYSVCAIVPVPSAVRLQGFRARNTRARKHTNAAHTNNTNIDLFGQQMQSKSLRKASPLTFLYFHTRIDTLKLEAE